MTRPNSKLFKALAGAMAETRPMETRPESLMWQQWLKDSNAVARALLGLSGRLSRFDWTKWQEDIRKGER